MKQLFLIEDSLSNKISYYHLVCFLVALPFDRFYSELVLISFVIHTLLHLTWDRVKRVLSREVIIVSAVYLVGLLSLIYSSEKKQALTEAFIQVALVLFPVTLTCNSLDLKKYKWPLLKIFGYTCTIAVAYLYIDALLTIWYFHLPFTSLFEAAFMNQNFSAPIEMHATYLSMYVAFSICNFLVCCSKKEAAINRIFYFICMMVLTAALLQLSSRAVGIALLLIIFFIFPLSLFGKKRKMLVAGIAAAGVVIVFAVIQQNNAFRERYFSELQKDLSPYTNNIEVTEPRMVRWKAAMELVRESPVIGYGSGSEVALLKEKYFDHKLYSSYLHQFNAHNQYISLLIKTGIPGLLIYLSVLIYGLMIAWKKRDLSFAAFMVLLTVTSMSENILDLNKGIFFYSFFFSFFLLVNKKAGLRETASLSGNQSPALDDYTSQGMK